MRGRTVDVPLWPYLVWPGVSLVGLGFVLVWLTAFVDERWQALAWIFMLCGPATIITGGILGAFDVEVERRRRVRKPKDWRKLREDARRQAYIEALESECEMQIDSR